jgi:hypothetical protein
MAEAYGMVFVVEIVASVQDLLHCTPASVPGGLVLDGAQRAESARSVFHFCIGK